MNICGRCGKPCGLQMLCDVCRSEQKGLREQITFAVKDAVQQEVSAALNEKALLESLLNVEYVKVNREQDRRIIALLAGHLRRALIDYENNHEHSLCGLETLEDLQLLEEN